MPDPTEPVSAPAQRSMNIVEALELAIDWHNPDTRAFVARYGHGMSGREMVALLREAYREANPPTPTGYLPGGLEELMPGRCAACDTVAANYCGWDRWWTCSEHLCVHPERPTGRPS